MLRKMNKRFLACLLLFGMIGVLIHGQDAETINAVVFPELRITMNNSAEYRGKIIALRASDVELLPYPYWNVESLALDINKMQEIRIPKKEHAVIIGLVWTSGISFAAVGTFGLMWGYDQNDVDYSFILGVASYMAGVVALGGLSTGLLIELIDFKENLTWMNLGQRIEAIMSIMGLRIH